MSCDHYQQMLYLYRHGELSEDEARELNEHLLSCSACALEHEQILRTEPYVRRLRDFTPALRQADELAEEILARIRARGAPLVQSSPLSLIDRVLERFLLPSVRYASAIFVIAVAGSFLLQYYRSLDRVAQLEHGMSSPSVAAARPAAAYAVRMSQIRHLADSSLVQRLSPLGEQTAANDVVIVNSQTLKSFLPILDDRLLSSLSSMYRGEWNREKLEMLVGYIRDHSYTVFRMTSKGD